MVSGPITGPAVAPGVPGLLVGVPLAADGAEVVYVLNGSLQGEVSLSDATAVLSGEAPNSDAGTALGPAGGAAPTTGHGAAGAGGAD